MYIGAYMKQLNWDLHVLSRSIAYPNLSAAATHVGLSQPQLSRIVAALEEQYGLQLLDREARRKAAWTPAAYGLVEIYSTTVRQFEGDIQKIAHGQELTHLKVGTLEGLIPIGSFANDFEAVLASQA